MAKRYKYTALLLLFVLVSLWLPAQDLKLMPARTRLVNITTDDQGEVVMASYRYESRHSKEGILEFYRQLFHNQGFSEIKGQPPKKDSHKLNYFFTKQEEGASVLLNFLRLVDEGVITYYLTTYHFSLKPESEYLKPQPDSVD